MCCCCIALSTALDGVARSGATGRSAGAGAHRRTWHFRGQSSAELFDGLTDPLVHHVQLPFNLLDHRWSEFGVIAALRARPEVIVHVRSILLQGLLSGRAEARWPRLPDVGPATIVDSLERNAAMLKRESIVDLVSHMCAHMIGSTALLSVWKRQSKWQRTSPDSHDSRCRPHS